MKIRATFDIELPDALASALLRKSGVVLVEKGDQMAALTLMALRPIPGVLREFLLAPDRKPMRTGTPARLTTEASETSIDLTLTETTECTPSPRKSASSSKPRSTPSTTPNSSAKPTKRSAKSSSRAAEPSQSKRRAQRPKPAR